MSNPTVIGAVIDLGNSLDLTTLAGIDMVRTAYRSLESTLKQAGRDLPHNQDGARRQLDCAVIQHLHAIYESEGQYLDSVRGVFTEGQELYPGAGFAEGTHVQIAVRNPDCIKGVFRVPRRHLSPWRPDAARRPR